MKRIYIAGPMTDVPGHNVEKFNAKERELLEAGYLVANPVRIGEPFGPFDEVNDDPVALRELIRKELGDLARCDAIYLLDGWERSKGSRLELMVALDIGLEIIVEGRETLA